MYHTEDIEIQKLKVNNYVLGRDGSVYVVTHKKSHGKNEIFLTLKSMDDGVTTIGSSVNDWIFKRVLNY